MSDLRSLSRLSLALWLVVCTATMQAGVETNPLITGSQLEHGTFEWDKVKPEHVVPALKVAIEKAEKRAADIVADPAEPDFTNTIVALEFIGPELNYAASVFQGLQGLLQEEYNPIAAEAQALLDAYQTKLSFNKELFARVEKVYNRREELALQPHQLRLLQKTYESYVRNGVNQTPETIERITAIKNELGQLTTKFGENATKSKETFELHITDKKKLDGLSERFLARARHRAEDKGLTGWLITLDTADYTDVLTYATDPDLRKQLLVARQMTGYKSGPDGNHPEYDNRQVILDIVRLRDEEAKLLGFKNHAELALQDKMAESPERVMKFMDDFLVQIKPAAQKDLDRLKAYKKTKTGSDEMEAWDTTFWSARYKEENLGVDEEKIRQYLPLERVLKDGVMKEGKLFWNIDFVERKDLPTYHPDVMTFEAQIDGKTIGLIYMDLFARKGKRSGAWVNPLRTHHIGPDGKEVIPLLILALNVSKAPAGQPNLLSMRETETLFHEAGHAYHSLLSQNEYATQNDVAWDFVEVPSQVPENLVYEKPMLELFARHHQTDEVIPDELIQKIKASKNYDVAGFELRQMSLAYIDMNWYTSETLPSIEDMAAFENAAEAKATLLPNNEDSLFSGAFGHIFSGGYHAGYYGYQWARVIGADLYAAFSEDGPFSLPQATKVAQRFRDEILAKGDTSSALQLFKNFRGREPDPKYFLEQLKQ